MKWKENKWKKEFIVFIAWYIKHQKTVRRECVKRLSDLVTLPACLLMPGRLLAYMDMLDVPLCLQCIIVHRAAFICTFNQNEPQSRFTLCLSAFVQFFNMSTLNVFLFYICTWNTFAYFSPQFPQLYSDFYRYMHLDVLWIKFRTLFIDESLLIFLRYSLPVVPVYNNKIEIQYS